MIQIEVFSPNVDGGRGFAKLFPDTKTSFVIDNFSLQDSVTPGEYSLPMKFPRKCINDTLFDFFHELPKDQRTFQWKANVYYNGQIKYTGQLEIIRSNDESFDGYIKILTGGLTCLDLLLPEIDYGEPIDLGADLDARINTLTAVLAQNYPSVTFNMPTYKNEKYYDGKNPEYSGVVNLYDNFTGKLFKPYIVGSPPGTPINKSPIVPMPYLMHVLKSGFAMSNMKVKGAFITDSDTSQLLLYNNRSLDRAYNKYTVGANMTVPIVGSSPTPGVTTGQPLVLDTEVSDPDNVFNPITGEYTISSVGFHRISGKITFTITNPDSDTMTLGTYMEHNGFASLGTNFHFTGATSAGTFTRDFSNSFFFDASYLGDTLILHASFRAMGGNTFSVSIDSVEATIENISNTGWNQLNDTLQLGAHVPNITFGDLLARIRNAFNLKLSYDLLAKSVDIDFAETVFDQLPIDLTEKAEPTYEFDNDSIKYKLLNYEFDSTDDLSEGKLNQGFDDDRILGFYDGYPDLPVANVKANVLAYVRSMNRWYESNIDSGTGALSWVPYSQGFPDEVVDETGDIEIKPECAPLFMDIIEDPTAVGKMMLVPAIEQVGSSAMHGIGDNDFNVRLLFYRGFMYQSDGSNVYPFGTSGNRNYFGVAINDRTLYWHSEYGLVEKSWGRWLKAVHRAPKCTITLNFNMLDYMNLDITGRFRYRTKNALMRSIKYSMGKYVEPGKAELILTRSVR